MRNVISNKVTEKWEFFTVCKSFPSITFLGFSFLHFLQRIQTQHCLFSFYDTHIKFFKAKICFAYIRTFC